MRLLTATALAALFAASPAGAQPSRDPAMAEALFARAKVLSSPPPSVRATLGPRGVTLRGAW